MDFLIIEIHRLVTIIKIGSEFGLFEGKKSYFIDEFKEKPDLKTAEKYLASFEYLWNSGSFIFSGRQLLSWVRQFVPETTDILQSFSFPLSETDAEKYAACANDPIDTAIIEKLPTDSRIVIPSSLIWSDIGSWDTLFTFLKHKSHAESVSQGNVITLHSEKNFVHASKEKLVALVGVHNLIVVETDDALLILHKDEADKMKELIATLKKEGKEKYL
jgi:mannose-1-phosphate guanylyltransferase